MKKRIEFAVFYNGRTVASFATERVARLLAEVLGTKAIRIVSLIAE